MRPWSLATLALALAVPAAPAAEPPNPAPNAAHDLAANAALKYWEAFALMPPLDKDQEARLARWDEVPIDAEAQKLVAASAESLRSLRRGAKLRRCDWGLDYDDGLNLLLPYLAKSRDLARLAALHARSEFERGRREAGAEDAIAILALSRHIGSEPIMISILVGDLIESTAVDLLALYPKDLPAVGPRVFAAYEALPAGAAFSQAYLTAEKQHTVRWLVRALKDAEAKQPGGWRAVWEKTFSEPEGREAVRGVTTFEQAVRQTEALLPVCDELAALVDLPAGEFDARYPAYKASVKAEHPFAGQLLTGPNRVLAPRRRNQARMAMLKAAAAVVRDGPEALKAFKDPFGDGPFAYRALGARFELASKLLDHDRPVTPTLGRPAR
jgi:hypothetical protein